MAPVRTQSGTVTPQRQATGTVRAKTPTSRARGASGTPNSSRLANKRSVSSVNGAGGTSSNNSNSSSNPELASVTERKLVMEEAQSPVQEKTGGGRKGKGGSDNIVVAVRVRGFLDREKQKKTDVPCIRMKNETTEVTYSRGKHKYSFDHCFWSAADIEDPQMPYASQEDVYNTLGVPVIENAMKGFNSSIIAYGQTGSGKSYSIFGPPNSIGNEQAGLIPRVCKELFSRIATGRQAATYKVTAAMLEVYMEHVHDLLNQRNQLTIRGDLVRGFGVPGCTRKEVKSYSDIESLLKVGEKSKTFACTALNERSSRAHTVFELEIRCFSTCSTGVQKCTTSKITLCDLAGSERQKDAKTDGKVFSQACGINMSLLCLGKCVESVVQHGGSRVTEFRNSSLTKLLKDSIGGNSKTVILVAISPSEIDAHTTHQALRFADRAKAIENHAVINEDALHDAQNKKKLMEEIYKDRRDKLAADYALEQQQAELTENQLKLEAECVRLQAEKEALEKQRQEMTRKGLTDSEKRRLEQKQTELTRKLQNAVKEYELVQDKVMALEKQMYSDSQNARREKEELDELNERLETNLEMLHRQYDEDQQAWQEEREELQRQFRLESEKAKAAHCATIEKKEDRFLEERKKYVEQMMSAVQKIQNDMQNKEEKWKAKEEEWEQRLKDLTAKNKDLTRSGAELAKTRDTVGELQAKLAAAKSGQEADTSKITALYEEITELKSKTESLSEDLDDAVVILQRESGLPDSQDIAEMGSRLSELRRSAASEKEEAVVNLNMEVQRSQAQAQKRDQMLKDEKAKSDQQLKELKKKLEDHKRRSEETIEGLEAELRMAKEKQFEGVSAAQSEMESKVSALMQQQQKAASDAQDQHEAEVLDLKKQLSVLFRSEEQFRTEAKELAEDKVALQKEVADLDRTLEDTLAQLNSKTKSLLEARDTHDTLTASSSTVEKRFAATKLQLQEAEGQVEHLRKEMRELKKAQHDDIDAAYRKNRGEMEEMRRALEEEREQMIRKHEDDRRALKLRNEEELEEAKAHETERVRNLRSEMEGRMDDLAAERAKLVDEAIAQRHKMQLLEEQAEQAQREKRALERQFDEKLQAAQASSDTTAKDVQKMAARLAAAESKHKGEVDELMAKITYQAKKHSELIDNEKAKRRRLQDDLAEARQKEAMSMQNLLSVFQKTQNQFAAQLADETEQAKRIAEEDEEEEESDEDTRTPLMETNTQLTKSFADILKATKLASSGASLDKENCPPNEY